MAPKDEAALVKQFREELVEEDLLHDGDSVGTDDATLLQVLSARTAVDVLMLLQTILTCTTIQS